MLNFICNIAYTRHTEKLPLNLSSGKVKPDFFHCQGEVCFLSEELLSELLIVVFLTSTLLALVQTPILGDSQHYCSPWQSSTQWDNLLALLELFLLSCLLDSRTSMSPPTQHSFSDRLWCACPSVSYMTRFFLRLTSS